MNFPNRGPESGAWARETTAQREKTTAKDARREVSMGGASLDPDSATDRLPAAPRRVNRSQALQIRFKERGSDSSRFDRIQGAWIRFKPLGPDLRCLDPI